MGVSSNLKAEEEEKEVEKVVNEEEEDENELSLELSIGRKSYKKSNTLPQKSTGFDSSKMGFLDFAQENKASIFPSSQLDLPMDPLLKREIQALRRQEARKKRDEKLKIKAISKGKNGNFFSVNHEDEEETEMPPRKKEKNESFGNGEEEEHKLMVEDLKDKMRNGSDPTGQAPYAYQNVPFTNGFVYPYGVMPCYLGSAVGMEKEKRVSFVSGAGGIEGVEKEKRVSFEPVGYRSFQTYNQKVEQNGNAKSAGSSGCSSSASDYQKPSLKGGSSSSKFPQESRNASSAGNVPEKSQNKYYDSKGMNSNEVEVKTKVNHTVAIVSSTNIQFTESRCKEELKPAAPLKDPILITKNPIIPAPLKHEASNGVIRNLPKPQTECNGTSPLPQMPCVSTTGNGPNGKTITGFLYRYTKTEVCIVCVCHGTSFSPAEFVEHAGGVDVEHPLRHITILPSALA